MNEEPKKYVNGQSESFQLAPPVPTDKMPPAPGSVAGAAPAHIQPTPEARQVLPPATLGPQGGLEAVHADASAVHEQFLSVMLESHNAFLQLTRDAIGGGVMAGSGQQLTAPAALAPAPVAPFRAEAAPAAPARAPAPSPNLDAAVVSPAPAFAPQPVAAPPAPVAVQPAPAQPQASAPAPAANGAANGAAAPALSAERIKELAIEVIAEKTGYPSDTLEDSMELESDLGVDSISRVEIFMALKDKAPGLIDPATADQAEIGNLVTIGDIGAYLARMASNAAEMGAPPPDVVEPPSPAPAAADEVPVSSGASAEDIKSVVVEIVADKTGYPTDLLEMDMQLEADLGVDSIKRMEILMGLGDKLPGQAPSQDDVDMNAVSNLLTLQDVVDFLAQAASSASHSDASAQAELEAGSADYLVPVEPSAQVEPLDRFLATAVDAPATGFALPGLSDGNPVLIIQDKGGVADALAEEFSRRGVGATVAGEAVETASKVVFLPGLDAVAGAEGSHLLHLDAFKAAKTAAMALMKPGGVFVSVQDTGGAFGFEPGPADKAWAGGLSGVVKTIGKCWPDTQIKAIDIER
ncbi:MAG: acyl carrier protein, partial [Pseudomonadota bacterium]